MVSSARFGMRRFVFRRVAKPASRTLSLIKAAWSIRKAAAPLSADFFGEAGELTPLGAIPLDSFILTMFIPISRGHKRV